MSCVNFNFFFFLKTGKKNDITLKRCRCNKYKTETIIVLTWISFSGSVCVHTEGGFHTSFDICSAQNTSRATTHLWKKNPLITTLFIKIWVCTEWEAWRKAQGLQLGQETIVIKHVYSSYSKLNFCLYIYIFFLPLAKFLTVLGLVHSSLNIFKKNFCCILEHTQAEVL